MSTKTNHDLLFHSIHAATQKAGYDPLLRRDAKGKGSIAGSLALIAFCIAVVGAHLYGVSGG